MATLSIETPSGQQVPITSKPLEFEEFTILVDGQPVGAFYFSERHGRPAITFGAVEDTAEGPGEFVPADEHHRSVNGEASIFFPQGVSL